MAEVKIIEQNYDTNTATILVDDGTGNPQTYTVLIAGTHRTEQHRASLIAAGIQALEAISLEEEKEYYYPYDRPKAFAYNRFVRGEYWVHGCDGHALLPNRIHDQLSCVLITCPYNRHTSGTPP